MNIEDRNIPDDAIPKLFDRMRRDPVFFKREILGGWEPWSKQIEIMEAVRDYQYVTVKSGHGVGKTAISSAIAWWFWCSFPGSIVVLTAPTALQLSTVLWAELCRQFSKSPMSQLIPATILDGMVKDPNNEKHYMVAISTNEPDRFAGQHSESGNMLIIVDEASGIDKEIHDAIKGLLTGKRCKLLYIGNPLRPSGAFYDSFYDPDFSRLFTEPLGKQITISCLDSPNVVQRKEIVPGLTTWESVEQRKIEWGETSPQYISRVVGDFPPEGDYQLIPPYLVTEAEGLKLPRQRRAAKGISLDVARYGSNKTVFMVSEGGTVTRIIPYDKKGTNETIGIAMQLIEEEDPDFMVIDDTGVGGTVYDVLSRRINDVLFYRFVAGSTECNEKFYNVRAEGYWELGEMMKNRAVSIPKGTPLKVELPRINMEFLDSGKIKIESKRKMRSKEVDSPDFGDALMMLMWAMRMFDPQESKPRETYRTLDNFNLNVGGYTNKPKSRRRARGY